jgi:hypothetical protein
MFRNTVTVGLMLSAALVAAFFALSQWSSRSRPQLTTPYQAVLLTNGQTLLGKLEDPGSAYPKLVDVFYVQNQVNPETKQISTNIIKRGKELHEPAYTIINANQILLIEPVKPESRIGKLIEDFKGK